MTNLIQAAWQDAFAPRDRRPIHEWAKDNVVLRPPLTKTGPFDVSGSRHFIPIFNALQDDHVREVNVLKPVRGGGTLIADIWVPWTRTIDPGPTMFLLQTDPIADDHFTKVLLPTLESVAAIKRQLDALDRHKKTGRKIEFADNNHLHVNGPSIGNLQTNAFRYIVQSEPWLYDKGRIGEADGRVGDYLKQQRSKIFRESQAGPRDGIELDQDEWSMKYHSGQVHEWQIQCESCLKFMDAAFNGQRPDGSYWGLVWDKEKLPNGDWNAAKACQSIRFECEHCGHPMLDSPRTKANWNRTGQYRAVGEENRKRVSFHWEAVIDYPWDELVELWLEACNAEHRGDLKPKIQFYQKRRAMFMDEASILRGGLSFKRTPYEITSTWPDELYRFMTVDKQSEGLYWWSVRAWSKTESRRLGFGKAYGEAELIEIQKKFNVKQFCVAVDSAFEPKGDRGVYAMCARNNWFAFRGNDRYEFIHKVTRQGKIFNIARSHSVTEKADPEAGKRGEGNYYAQLKHFSKPRMNQKVQDLIDSGAWKEPINDSSETEKEYSAQMASRIKVTDYDKRTNAVRIFWREGKNDHARDLANLQTTFAMIMELIPDSASEQLTKSEQPPTTTP